MLTFITPTYPVFQVLQVLQMFKMRFGAALAFIAVVVCARLQECTATCQMASQNDYVEGDCPVVLTPVLPQASPMIYSECITVRVWIKAEDFSKCPKIEILSKYKDVIWPTLKQRKRQKCVSARKRGESRVRCDAGVAEPHSNTTFAVWELVHDCIKAEANRVVSASYITTSSSCSVSYRVPDPMPDFDLSVNQSSKSISVTVEPGDKVHARWCYRRTAGHYGAPSLPITIDPSQSRSAVLDIPYLLPCVCVQVYYTRTDSRRHIKCPFLSLTDFRDVWPSSKVTPYESHLQWSLECPPSDLNVSASLCWRQNEHLCIPVLNSTLHGEDDRTNLIYDTSAVDKHPDMCVQFSLPGSHNISCPFKHDKSSWEVYIGPGRQSFFLYLTSNVAAKFSAQLCVLTKSGCTPMGQVHSVIMGGNATETRINVPLTGFLAVKPCVQVWQSDPALRGRRILCLDYTHNRWGMYAVAALVFVVIVALLGIFIHHLAKNGAAGLLCIQEPVLLVCSSEQSAHVSAVCALASILQGELSAAVHMALWAQTSQAKAGTGVADLGPLPWLYGQWEAVRKAQGRVLIVWSPDARKMYEKWREERANMGKTERKEEDYSKAEARHENMTEEDLKLNGRRLGKWKRDKAAGKKDYKICDDTDLYTQREPSSVITPVFTAALACLEGALQEGKCQGVALVYFQGLCHSRDIPKAFRGVPRYCLPQDFRGLIQELGGMRRQTKFRRHCWPRLLSKVMSIWLARQLAQRLQTLLPQTRREKMQRLRVTSAARMMSDKTQSRLKWPLAANVAKPGTVQEHEPLHESPW